MTTRASQVLVVITAFFAGLIVFLGIFLYATGQIGGGAAPSAIGGPFQLTDQDGNRITEQDFRGKPYLVFFGFTHCPDICPTTLFEVSEVMNALGEDADRVSALFVSVDPERDTPAVIKDYLSSFDPHVRGATGTKKQLEQVAKGFRTFFKKHPTGNGDYSMDHSAIVYLMDKDGRFVAPFNLKRPPQDAANDLRKYL